MSSYEGLPADVQALLDSVSKAENMEAALPVTAAAAAGERRKEEERQAKMAAELQKLADPDHLIGETIRDQGIYIGRYVLFQNGGLHKTFNIFAAPQDLTDDTGRESAYTYDEAVQRVAGLENWHGHDGADYKDAEQIREALKTGTYNGGWIVPPCSMLGNVLKHKDEGALKDSFMKAAASQSSFPARPEEYWSSTVRNLDCWVNIIDFRSGSGRYSETGHNFSCRPVRLVPVNH